MFYILIAFAVGVSFFIATTAFILGGPVVGVCVSLPLAIACVWWLCEFHTLWGEE